MENAHLIIAAQHINKASFETLLQYSSNGAYLAIANEFPKLIGTSRNKLIRNTDSSNKQSKHFLQDIQTFFDCTHGQHDKKSIYIPEHIKIQWKNKYGILNRENPFDASLALIQIKQMTPAVFLSKFDINNHTLSSFVAENHTPVISVEEIKKAFIMHEILITKKASARIPIANLGDFDMSVFQYANTKHDHVLLSKNLSSQKAPIVRVHSECFTGDIFSSMRCDCGDQLHQALQKIAKEGGALIYLRQEGRGIGLSKKLEAYNLQEKGLDTFEANVALGLPDDDREYIVAYQILKHLNCNTIKLITNNPQKVSELTSYGINITKVIPSITTSNKEIQAYLEAKQHKKGHALEASITKSLDVV